MELNPKINAESCMAIYEIINNKLLKMGREVYSTANNEGEIADNIKKKYTQLESPKLSLQRIFEGFIFSAVNAQFKKNTINFHIDESNRSQAIRQILYKKSSLNINDHDFRKVLLQLKELDPEDLFIKFQRASYLDKKHNARPLIIGKGTKTWEGWSKTIIDVANLLIQFKDTDAFRQFIIRSLPPPFPALVLRRHIFGMSLTLVCDSLKDMGFHDYSKPDVHILDVFIQSGLIKNYKNSLDKELACFEAMREFVDLYNTTSQESEKLTQYELDKKIWMICSGKFYRDTDKALPSQKESLISEIQNFLGHN